MPYLTESAVRNAEPGVTPSGKVTTKPYKVGDSGGLYLEVTPTGGKYWRLKYRFRGKEKRLSLGVYPDVPLESPQGQDKIKGARELRDEARKLLSAGIDPSEHRKASKSAGAKRERAADSFEVVAREWFKKMSATWDSTHSHRIIRRFERDVFPSIGGMPIAEVTAPELLAVLRQIEARGALETAHRTLGSCGHVFRYAIATGRAELDPSGDLRGALLPVKAATRPEPGPSDETTSDAEKAYALVAAELESESLRRGLWTRLWVENDGDDRKTRLAYIKVRSGEIEEAMRRAHAAADNAAAWIAEGMLRRLEDEGKKANAARRKMLEQFAKATGTDLVDEKAAAIEMSGGQIRRVVRWGGIAGAGYHVVFQGERHTFKSTKDFISWFDEVAAPRVKRMIDSGDRGV